MAEFPGLGEHCSHQECRQLDFLPIKCYGCKSMYCQKHYTYESHNCPSGLRTNNMVPVCPLCDQPVPTAKNESPDVVVSQHIDRDCQSDPARKKRAYVNLCSLKRCKRRELIRITCDKCRRNFCVTHRFYGDHDCTGMRPNPELRPPFNSSTSKQRAPSPPTDNDASIARKLHDLLNMGPAQCSPEEMDRRLAEQLQREEYNSTTTAVGGAETRRTGSSQCTIS